MDLKPLFSPEAIAVIGVLPAALLAQVYSGTAYRNELPEDYSFLYGEDRPFAPSLARTSTGGAFDARSLAGSESCGSSQICPNTLGSFGRSCTTA